MHVIKKIIPCILVISFAACTPSEKYLKPDISLPASWKGANVTKAKSPFEIKENNSECAEHNSDTNNALRACENKTQNRKWWESFGDPVLSELIDQALANNYDLKIADARINEAKAIRRGTLSKLFPSIDATASTSRLGGQASLGNSNEANNQWQAGANITWVADLFGQTRTEVAAADSASARAQAEYSGTTLSLISEVAGTYVEMRALQQRIDLTQKNLILQQDTLRLTSIQYNSQAVSKLDMLRSSAQVETTRAEIQSIDTMLTSSYNRLAVLKGSVPDADKKLQIKTPIPVFAEKVAMDTPIDTVAARPDVQAAEANLMEATSLKNVASAEYFPKLSLSAFFGVGDASLSAASSPWSLGANALLPLLNFGRIESQIDAADARKIQALNNYKQVVLKALEEVENALVYYNNEIKRAGFLDKAAKDTEEAARIARIKYKAGDSTFLDVLIVEERLLAVESDAVISHANVAKAAITLQTALGINEPVSPPAKMME